MNSLRYIFCNDFEKEVIEHIKFIDNLTEKGLLQNDISGFNVLEIGGGICVYPRFWTNSDKLKSIDKELLNRAVSKNQDWNEFEDRLKDKLRDLNLKIEHYGILESHEMMPIGGDVIIGSKKK